MDNLKIIDADAKILQSLIDGSALTVEGLKYESIKDFIAQIEDHTPLRNRVAYVTKGKLANSEWGLHGSNAYPEDLNIVSVKLEDMEDWNKIMMPRFAVGTRWMDDIYDNNIRREKRSRMK